MIKIDAEGKKRLVLLRGEAELGDGVVLPLGSGTGGIGSVALKKITNDDGSESLYLVVDGITSAEWISLPKGCGCDCDGGGIGSVGLVTDTDEAGFEYLYIVVDGERVGDGILLTREDGGDDIEPENLDKEIAEQYSLVEQIRRSLLDKINVVGISKIEKTSSDGLIDTYTIYFTDNTTETFTVTNGKNGENGDVGNHRSPRG